MKLLRLPKNEIGSALVEMWDSIEKSRTARLTGNHYQYRTPSQKARALLRRGRDVVMLMFSDLPIKP